MYDYQTERPKLFTEHGQVMFIRMRDNTHRLLKVAGAARMDKIMKGVVGESWLMLACLDRMIELDEVVEISPPSAVGQHRVVVWKDWA